MAAKDISPTRFYTEVLGAALSNSRWSWGAHDPVKGRVYLRVWTDEMVDVEGSSYALVLRNETQASPGRPERERHLELVNAGAEAFGILCTPGGPRVPGEPRKIRNFDRQSLLRLGRLIDLPAGKYVEVLDRVPVEDVMRPASGAATLRSDLNAIQREKGLTATEREALISARIGQGAFRTRVLSLWNGCCAVTGCSVAEAIRASHIKPWRLSNNEERLDPRNGLPLLATLDALFDAGLISFADNGAMLTSSRLKASERERLGVHGNHLRRPPSGATVIHLADHRVRFGFPSS